MTRPSAGDAEPDSVDDFSALAWVHDELRRSLEVAHKSLRRFLREAEAVGVSDLDAVDPAVLRTARSQIHQGVGALELVGLPAAAALLRASEALVQRVVAKPQRLNAGIVEVIERASFGLLDYLMRLLAGRDVSPLSLFPQYRAVRRRRGPTASTRRTCGRSTGNGASCPPTRVRCPGRSTSRPAAPSKASC